MYAAAYVTATDLETNFQKYVIFECVIREVTWNGVDIFYFGTLLKHSLGKVHFVNWS